MNVGNIDDTRVKTFPSSEVGLISFDGYFGYLLVFICCGALTQIFDLIKEICHSAAALGSCTGHFLGWYCFCRKSYYELIKLFMQRLEYTSLKTYKHTYIHDPPL